MATRKVTEGVGMWNNTIPFPKDRYVCHCISEERKKAASSNLMLVREWEIVKPETIKVGDKEFNIAGQKVTQYLTFKVHAVDDNGKALDTWDAAKCELAFGRLRDDLLKLGFDGEEIDDENPPLIAKGKTVDLILYGKEDKKYKSPTPEQIAKGIKRGDPIKGPDGKDIVAYQLQIDGGVFGLSDEVKVDSSAF